MDYFLNFDPLDQPAMRLFCFPHAGGGAAIYRGFADRLADSVEVWAANLPGHGSRLRETPLVDLQRTALLLAQAVTSLSDRPFAFFGHSLGARLAFETARVLRAREEALPLHLYAAGSQAPQQPPPNREWHKLPEKDLLAELRRHNGLPGELLDEPQVLAYFLPALRADLQMIETAVYHPEPPFEFPITALGGNHDPLVNVKQLAAWQEQTTGQFRLALFEGDHFFLQATKTAVLNSMVNEKLGPN